MWVLFLCVCFSCLFGLYPSELSCCLCLGCFHEYPFYFLAKKIKTIKIKLPINEIYYSGARLFSILTISTSLLPDPQNFHFRFSVLDLLIFNPFDSNDFVQTPKIQLIVHFLIWLIRTTSSMNNRHHGTLS